MSAGTGTESFSAPPSLLDYNPLEELRVLFDLDLLVIVTDPTMQRYLLARRSCYAIRIRLEPWHQPEAGDLMGRIVRELPDRYFCPSRPM